ncbi:MAG: class I SAM-dependent methyltransferase [Candidatus Hodarchaeota archaeon]
MEEHFKNSNKKKVIINKYNSSAHFYDRRYKQIQSEKYELILNNYYVNGKTILDIGCGTGLLFEYISKLKKADYLNRYKYVAIDISWNMLSEFKSKVINYKPKNNLELILGDIENLPFRENVFDSIFSITSLQNLANINRGICELLRLSMNYGDFNFSILRKKLNLDALLDLIKPFSREIKTIDKDFLEDVIILGKFVKK